MSSHNLTFELSRELNEQATKFGVMSFFFIFFSVGLAVTVAVSTVLNHRKMKKKIEDSKKNRDMRDSGSFEDNRAG